MRTLTPGFLAALNAAQTPRVLITLLELYDQAGNQFLFCDNSVDITSNGRVFLAWPFEIQLPTSEQGRISHASLVFDNVARELIDEIRTLTQPFDVVVSLILDDEPNATVAIWRGFQWRALSYDATSVRGILSIESFTSEPFPGKTMNGQHYPGLFFL